MKLRKNKTIAGCQSNDHLSLFSSIQYAHYHSLYIGPRISKFHFIRNIIIIARNGNNDEAKKEEYNNRLSVKFISICFAAHKMYIITTST
ncbi:hypothetical protein HanIR_Chr11g0509531 [Helianthus annuus]|nr:hypothetical protein HanIR_Chr11g0509531 [Helianthus annuus]